MENEIIVTVILTFCSAEAFFIISGFIIKFIIDNKSDIDQTNEHEKANCHFSNNLIIYTNV